VSASDYKKCSAAELVEVWQLCKWNYLSPHVSSLASESGPETWVELFRQHDYILCSTPNFELEEGFEKIAIYAKSGELTHIARQLITGLWTSKLGQSWRVTHRSLEVHRHETVKKGEHVISIVDKQEVLPHYLSRQRNHSIARAC
jgi:hypothetical protein